MTSRRQFLLRTTAAGLLAASSGYGQAARTGVVQTVLGPIDASKLGFTLTHEHVIPGSKQVFRSRESSLADAVGKLKAARDAGIATVVDLTPADAGRDVRFVAEVSRRSGMQIVASTGQRLYPPELGSRTLEELTGIFTQEIERGIDDTDIKAGVIKAATVSAGVTANEERVLRAAARASKATGIAIETHSNSGQRGGETQADIFDSEGVNPARVSIGHSDDTDDVDYFIRLARRGYTLGMDHTMWGLAEGAELPWQKRAAAIKKLVDAGFVDKIVFSNDWVHGDLEREKVNPDGMLFTVRKTIPYLRQLGVSQRQIETITVKNPARLLASS